jgi:hypothetical protein
MSVVRDRICMETEGSIDHVAFFHRHHEMAGKPMSVRRAPSQLTLG